MLVDVITAYVDGATAEGYAEDWDLERCGGRCSRSTRWASTTTTCIDTEAVGEPGELTREELLDALIADADKAYAKREAEIEAMAGEGAMRQLERNVLLNVIDRKWREHLYEMDYLKEGIGLRAMAQRDPLVEYQREGYDMFIGMLEGMKEESVGFLFNVQVEAVPQTPAVAPVEAPQGLADLAAAAAQQSQPAEQTRPATEPVRPSQQTSTGPRHAAPAAVRAKGLDGDDDSRQLTYSGPAEDGSAEVKRNGGGGQQPAAVGATRKERREAARRQAKEQKTLRRS